MHKGKILVSLPKNTKVNFHGLVEMRVDELISEKSIEDFITEIEDAINELNGRKLGSPFVSKPIKAVYWRGVKAV